MKIHILAKQFKATVVESLLWAYQLTLTELSNQGLTHSTSGH
jgi:hypothetical protein